MLAICSRRSPTLSPTQELAALLVAGLQWELDLTPKPGLVDRRDNGSHQDLNYPLMARSIRLLERYFFDCAADLEAGHDLGRLRQRGIAAERAMLEQLGANTHRGAIFLGGLLLGAVHAAAARDSATVSVAVADTARRLFEAGLPAGTPGSEARARYGAGGIIREALRGFPSVFEVGVPALRDAGRLGFDWRDGLFLAMARLMQTVEDTTALRRCGPAGVACLQRDGAKLETLLLDGGDPVVFLTGANRRYQLQRLTMGGVADLLAISVAWRLFGSPDRGPTRRVGEGVGAREKSLILAEQYREPNPRTALSREPPSGWR